MNPNVPHSGRSSSSRSPGRTSNAAASSTAWRTDTGLVVHGELREARRARRRERDEQILRRRLVVDGPVSSASPSHAMTAQPTSAHAGSRAADDDDRLAARSGPGLGRDRSRSGCRRTRRPPTSTPARRALQHVAQLVGTVAGVEADDRAPRAAPRPRSARATPAGWAASTTIGRSADAPAAARPAASRSVPATSVTDRQRALPPVALDGHDVVGPFVAPRLQELRQRRRVPRRDHPASVASRALVIGSLSSVRTLPTEAAERADHGREVDRWSGDERCVG